MWSKAGPGTDVVADVDAILISRPWGTSNPRARRAIPRPDRPTDRQTERLHDLSVMGSPCPLPPLPLSQQVAPLPIGSPIPTTRPYPLGTNGRLYDMDHPNLDDKQAARADALDVAHRLLSGRSPGKGPLTASGRDGLLTDELPHAVLLAQYVLTGHYSTDLPDTEPEQPESIAGATDSTSSEEVDYL